MKKLLFVFWLVICFLVVSCSNKATSPDRIALNGTYESQDLIDGKRVEYRFVSSTRVYVSGISYSYRIAGTKVLKLSKFITMGNSISLSLDMDTEAPNIIIDNKVYIKK